MESRYTPDQQTFSNLNKQQVRDNFVIGSLFKPGELELIYTDVDRAIVGSAMPRNDALALPQSDMLGTSYFTERREIGVINIGGDGVVELDEEEFELSKNDSLYIGSGNRRVVFSSHSVVTPAKFYLVSYPAHCTYPSKKVAPEEANKLELGDPLTANERIIHQSIAPDIVDSCQIVMGFTTLLGGSVWNTFPPHTHARRTEIYMYYDMDEDSRVFHFIGTPAENSSVALKSGETVLSPSWSMHTGVGTRAYSFIWAMGGENQIFDDMDQIDINELR